MSIGSDIGGAEETVDVIGFLAVLGVVIYLIWKYPDIVDSIKNDLNIVGNAVYSPSFPGGGQVAGTSETYTGALSETVSDPVGTLGTILSPTGDTMPTPGSGCFECGSGEFLAGLCRQDQLGQQVCNTF